MSKYVFKVLRGGLFLSLLALAGLLASPTMSGAQVFRGPAAKGPAILPPTPTVNLLNNGSLNTSVNPKPGNPNQLPFAYIAGIDQNQRLVHNGVPVDVSRLYSSLDGFDFTASAPAGTIAPVNAPSGTINYTIAGFGGNRPPFAGMPASPMTYPGMGYYPGYVPAYTPTGAYVGTTAQPGWGGGFNAGTTSVVSANAPYVSGLTTTFGTFGGANNPFWADPPEGTPANDRNDR